MILQVKGVSKFFGGLRALNEVDFDLPEGMILGLIGPNGAGKTTLFNVIGNVFSPDQGSILFQGEDLVGRPTSVSYTHLRAHETDSYLVCRLLLEKKKKHKTHNTTQ